MKRVYISGKIGEEVISEATRQKFAKAEEMLRAKGYDEVFNPASDEWQEFLSMNWSAAYPLAVMDKYTYILLKDLQKMAKYDTVYFLDDWKKSPGATSEYYYAKATGKRMFFEDRHDACEYLVQRMYDELNAEGKTLEYDGVQDRNDIEIAYFTKRLDEAWLPTK